MKTISVYDAEGMVLCHDLTQIIPCEYKGPAFKKGHIIKTEDIQRLLDMGKENLFVWDLSEGLVHEDDAAKRIAVAVAGMGINMSSPEEGKIELTASIDGLLKINTGALYEINSFPEVMLATLHTNQRVMAGKPVAGTRIIPLVVGEEIIKNLEDKCKNYSYIVQVIPFKSLKVGIVTTGSEIYHGRIKDAFGPVVRRKIEESGNSVLDQVFVPDSAEMISDAVKSLIGRGADAIAVTGGMSVDPDDVTPAGIRNAGATVISYGAPVLPGAMFMLAYIGKIPVMGLPGCVMYYRTTVFDIVFARVQAGESIEREDIVKLAHGGMCLNCAECRYPVCAFGKV